MSRKTPLPFAEWAPDQSTVAGVAAEAKGVIYIGGRYAPDKDFIALKAGASIGGTAIGGAAYHQDGVNVRTFVGDEGALYEIVARTPQDVSTIGGYAANPDWVWSFEQFGTSIFATARGLPNVQYYTFGSSTRFADLTGPGASDGVFRIREHLFSGKAFTMKYSDFNSPFNWSIGVGASVAGSFDLPHDGGLFVRGFGGQSGVIFQERKIHRLTYTGGDVPFERDEIEDKVGCMAPNAATRYGNLIYFASEDGFRVTDGNSSQAIGTNQIDRYFASRLNYAQRARISMAVDMERRLLRCIFPTGGNGRPSEMLTYSIADQKWTHDDTELDLIFEAPRAGISVNDDAAIAAVAGSSIVDEVNIPVDSPVWLESRKQVLAVNRLGEAGTLEGSNRAATLETSYGQITPGRTTFVSEVWPVTDAANVSAVITSKLHRLSDTPTSTSTATMNYAGFVPVLAEGRWIKAQVTIPYGTSWTEASGVAWDARQAGEL